MSGETKYNSWTKTGLIQRVKELERELRRRPEVPGSGSAVVPNADNEAAPEGSGRGSKKGCAKGQRKVDPSRYSSRFIALKLAYLGKNYGGFEFQAMGCRPSIEEELWKALTKACLIFPEDPRVVQFDCCEYSKCGRTDRGVSAFGQVIGLRVRSNRPLAAKRAETDDAPLSAEGGRSPQAAPGRAPGGMSSNEGPWMGGSSNREASAGGPWAPNKEQGAGEDEQEQEQAPFDDVDDELCYPRILNRLLPDDIRILAWCPRPPADFSARFSCRERQYRYFFTQPAFAPDPTAPGLDASEPVLRPGWLDIEAMRDAAKRFEGDHDFRNFCKIDPAKQMSNFRRRIFESDIVEVPDGAGSALPFLQSRGCWPSSSDPMSATGPRHPKVYCFHVRGSAFLWHQIRHMVAILFLVGQRLEPPAVVSHLLDTERNPRRPSYVMADEVPLVLWDCLFPDLSSPEAEDVTAAEAPARRTDRLGWIYVGDEHAPGKLGQFGVMESTWRLWRAHKMDELLSAQLLQVISQQGSAARHDAEKPVDKTPPSATVFEGGNGGRLAGRYVPVAGKPLLQSPEEQNDRYARRKGYADAADMRARAEVRRPSGGQ